MNILILCKANYCRSPVCEKILDSLLDDSYIVSSRGIIEYTSPSMHQESIDFLDSKGYNNLFHNPKKVAYSELNTADIILVGVSRTSKTPTSIYLANRGIKTANIPFIDGISLPNELYNLRNPLIIGLIATPERVVQIRKNRLMALNESGDTNYIDKRSVSDEIIKAKKIFEKNNWPVIDVTRRSIEETAAEIMSLLRQRKLEHNENENNSSI